MQLNNEDEVVQRGVPMISWTEFMCQPLRCMTCMIGTDLLMTWWEKREIEYANLETPRSDGVGFVNGYTICSYAVSRPVHLPSAGRFCGIDD